MCIFYQSVITTGAQACCWCVRLFETPYGFKHFCETAHVQCWGISQTHLCADALMLLCGLSWLWCHWSLGLQQPSCRPSQWCPSADHISARLCIAALSHVLPWNMFHYLRKTIQNDCKQCWCRLYCDTLPGRFAQLASRFDSLDFRETEVHNVVRGQLWQLSRADSSHFTVSHPIGFKFIQPWDGNWKITVWPLNN